MRLILPPYSKWRAISASSAFRVLPSSSFASLARASRRSRASSCFFFSASIRSCFSRWARRAYAFARSISSWLRPALRSVPCFASPGPCRLPFPLRPPSARPGPPSLRRRGSLRSGAGALKPRPNSWSRSELLISFSIMRRRRFLRRIGEERTARLADFLQPAAQRLGVARGLGAHLGERVAELGQRLVLESQPGFQLH